MARTFGGLDTGEHRSMKVGFFIAIMKTILNQLFYDFVANGQEILMCTYLMTTSSTQNRLDSPILRCSASNNTPWNKIMFFQQIPLSLSLLKCLTGGLLDSFKVTANHFMLVSMVREKDLQRFLPGSILVKTRILTQLYHGVFPWRMILKSSLPVKLHAGNILTRRKGMKKNLKP